MIFPQFVIYVLIEDYLKFRKDPSITFQEIANYISVALAVALSVDCWAASWVKLLIDYEKKGTNQLCYLFSFLLLTKYYGVQRRMISVFHIFEIIIFCFVVAICDLVHPVEATYGLP